MLQNVNYVLRRSNTSAIVLRQRAHPDRDELRALMDMKTPEDREELRRFFGMVAYLAKFLKSYSEVMGSLTHLLKDASVWLLGHEQDKAFRSLKRMLSQTPVLAIYHTEADTVVSADASSYGVGAVLLQVQPDGRRAPVAYASRALAQRE